MRSGGITRNFFRRRSCAAETRGGFLGFAFPVRATKVLGGFAVPPGGFGKLRGGFEEASDIASNRCLTAASVGPVAILGAYSSASRRKVWNFGNSVTGRRSP